MAAKKSAKKKATKKKTAKKKTAKKASTWGGKRKGAGRPEGSSKPRNPNARSHRIGVMVNDHDLKVLTTKAKARGIPVSTLAYRMLKGI